jgi:hypothetical protein
MKISFQRRYSAALAMVAYVCFGMFSGPAPTLVNAPGGGAPILPPGYAQTAYLPGLTSQTAGNPNQSGVSGTGQVPSGTIIFQSQSFTSATAWAPNAPGMSLADVCVEGGTDGGTYSFTYAPPSNAHFACPASTVGAGNAIAAGPRTIHYPVNYPIGGTSFGSSLTAFNGGVARVTLTYCTSPQTQNPIPDAYRAVYSNNQFSSATTASITVTFDAQPGIVRAVYCFLDNSSGTLTGICTGLITLPAQGGVQQIIPAQGTQSALQLVGAQAFFGQLSIITTYQCRSLGGATDVTVHGVFFY